jgi:hypothetical protein
MTTNKPDFLIAPSPQRGEGKGEGASGYKLRILANFSMEKV